MGLHACGLIRSGGHIGFLAVEPGFQRQGLQNNCCMHSVRHVLEQYSVTRITVNADPEIQAFYLACGFECRGDMQTESGVSFLPMEKMFSRQTCSQRKTHRSDRGSCRRQYTDPADLDRIGHFCGKKGIYIYG